jgi:hypothetical protein
MTDAEFSQVVVDALMNMPTKYDSPEEHPDAMLVTAEEVRQAVEMAIEEAKEEALGR